jgi:hypothetical protein
MVLTVADSSLKRLDQWNPLRCEDVELQEIAPLCLTLSGDQNTEWAFWICVRLS